MMNTDDVREWMDAHDQLHEELLTRVTDLEEWTLARRLHEPGDGAA